MTLLWLFFGKVKHLTCMARISADTIRSIREDVPISSVLEWLGVRMSGVNKAFCPLCHDKDSRHPGMVYDDARGTWHCFVHGDGGDAIDLVREYYGMSFSQAIEAIATKFGIEIAYDDDGTSEEERARLRRLVELHRMLEEIFVKQRVSPKFAGFVSSRNLSQDAIDRFGIGMSDARWASAVVSRLRARFSDDDIVASGVCFRTDDGRLILRWRDRVMFPIRNASGTIVAFGGRDVTGRAKGKYVNSPETPIFHKGNILYGYDTARRAISKERAAMVCEGYMDTIALQTHGFENAVGAMGTAVTERDLMTLSHDADRIVISLDADEPGRAAAAKVLDRIPAGFSPSVSVMLMPLDKAKDADEWLNQRGLPADGIRELADAAVPLYRFCLSNAISGQVATLADSHADDDTRVVARRDAGLEAMRLARRCGGKVSLDEMTATARWFVRTVGVQEQPEALAAAWIREGAAGSGRHAGVVAVPTTGMSARGADVAVGMLDVPDDDGMGEMLDSLIWMAYENPPDVGDALSALMDAGFSDEVASLVSGHDAKSVLLAKELGCMGHEALIDVLSADDRVLLDGVQARHLDEPSNYDAALGLCKRIVRAMIERSMSSDADGDFATKIQARQRMARLELVR